ncbi:MAG: O-antigen ligase family protein, partial [Patescibacteria group bacterium]|nr:O-antigen ligase family protein [Patescibacteria group bacterium]
YRMILLAFLLLPSVIFASSPTPAIYKYLKILLLILFSFWVKKNINLKKHLSTITTTLSLSVLFQSLLALAQWFKQSSIFGYWFFGEQPFNSATANIDKITWFTGAIKIPPMGTFPHPNVLAGFLAVTLPLILYKGINSNIRLRTLCYTSLLLGTITLFLTFSLSAWLAFLLIGLPLTLFNHLKKSISPLKFIFIYFGFFLILFSFATNFTFLAPASSFSRRSQLSKIAIKIIKHKPIFGIGLNNFTINMEKYGHVTATTRFLQPVHNIYLLILSETGIIGFIGFLYLLFLFFRLRALEKGPFLTSGKAGPFWIALLSLLFIGLFDHYPITIHQTILLFTFFLAL